MTTANNIAAAILKTHGSNNTSAYDVKATVTRVTDEEVFVHIDGGVPETPCQKTIDCKAGDVVKIRISGGSAWITGNATAPPTDDTRAIKADEKATNADIKAATAWVIADEEVENRNAIVREYRNGVLVAKQGNTCGALINAEGSFDVVEVSWAGEVPEAGKVLASFGKEIVIGHSESNRVIIRQAGLWSRFGSGRPLLMVGDPRGNAEINTTTIEDAFGVIIEES